MKKPVVVWAAQIYLLWSAIAAGLRALLSLVGAFNGAVAVAQAAGEFLLGAAVSAAAVLLLVRIARQAVARRVVVVFLWILLAVYPISNALRSSGFLPPQVPIADDELAGAALAETLHYLVPLALIVWLSFTKAAAEYLNGARPGTALQAPREDART